MTKFFTPAKQATQLNTDEFKMAIHYVAASRSITCAENRYDN